MIYHQGEFVYKRLQKICEAMSNEVLVDINTDIISHDLKILRNQRAISFQLIHDTKK